MQSPVLIVLVFRTAIAAMAVGDGDLSHGGPWSFCSTRPRGIPPPPVTEVHGQGGEEEDGEARAKGLHRPRRRSPRGWWTR